MLPHLRGSARPNASGGTAPRRRNFLSELSTYRCRQDYTPLTSPLSLYFSSSKKSVLLYDINHSKILFDPAPREMETKINKWDLKKLKSFLHSKGNHKQDEKTTLRMGKNICK